MRVREAAVRLKRFEVEEKNQRVSDLEQMINEFEQMAADLERQIEAEEERTGVRDRTHFAYSTFARSASQRRENLMASVQDLRARLTNAVTERDDAAAELEQADTIQFRDGDRKRDEMGSDTSPV
jgi:flagellar FliJ protein